MRLNIYAKIRFGHFFVFLALSFVICPPVHLTEILKVRHLLLIMRKKPETMLNVSYFEKIMSH